MIAIDPEASRVECACPACGETTLSRDPYATVFCEHCDDCTQLDPGCDRHRCPHGAWMWNECEACDSEEHPECVTCHRHRPASRLSGYGSLEIYRCHGCTAARVAWAAVCWADTWREQAYRELGPVAAEALYAEARAFARECEDPGLYPTYVREALGGGP